MGRAQPARELRASRKLLEFMREHPSPRQKGVTRGSADLSDAPVFVFGTGWRTGSTLLQRLLCSGSDTLIWGEPFGDAIPLARLANIVESLGHNPGHTAWCIDGAGRDLSLTDDFVANLNPGFDSLLGAFRAFCDTAFRTPARQAGYERWGLKSVRLAAPYAAFLKWLYPEARLILLARNPLDAWNSYKGAGWFTVQPHGRVNDPLRFFGHWAHIAESFHAMRDELDYLLVRYEDLIEDPAVLERIAAHTSIAIDPTILERRVGSSGSRSVVRPWDRLAARLVAGHAMRELGY